MQTQIPQATKKRGGAKPGAGRPRSTVARTRKTIDLPTQDAEKIDQLASDEGISAHLWMLRAISKALADAKGGV